LIDSSIVINTTGKTATTTELHSPLIRGIIVSLVSEHSTEMAIGLEVLSSRFRTLEYCLSKPGLQKTEVVSSPEVVSSRF